MDDQAHGFALPADAGSDERTIIFGDRPGWRRSTAWSRALLATQAAVDAAGGDLDVGIRAVTDGALRLMPRADGAVVALLDGEWIKLRGASGRFVDAPTLRMPTRGSLAGCTIAQGKPQLSRDAMNDPRVDRDACDAMEIGAMLSVPLKPHGATVGALMVFSREPFTFDEEDLLTAELLAGTLTVGLCSVLHSDVSRLRRAIAAACEGELWAIEASIGAVVVPAEVSVDPAQLIATADALMYRAKAGGEGEAIVLGCV